MKQYRTKEMLEILKKHIAKKYGNKQTNLAKEFKMSDAYISLIMMGEKQIPEWLAKDMGFTRIDPESYFVRSKK